MISVSAHDRSGEYQCAEAGPFLKLNFTVKCCRIFKLRDTDSGLAVATRVDRHQCRQASDKASGWFLYFVNMGII